MNSRNSYYTRITAHDNPMGVNLREIWKYRDLIALFTKRSVSLIYKQTVLGPVWILLNPFLTSIVYTIVFGEMAGLSTAGVPKLLFYLCSHSLWSFFSESLSRNSNTFRSNSHLYGKVYFPRLTIPISTVLYSAFTFLIHLCMVFVLIVIYVLRGEVQPCWGLMPLIVPLLLITGTLGLSIGILVSSVTTKYRDMQFLVSFGIRLWMYISPVIYPASQASEGIWRTVLLINPMTAPMEIFRYILLGTGEICPVSVISTLVFTAVFLPLSVLVFNRVEKHFIDTV